MLETCDSLAFVCHFYKIQLYLTDVETIKMTPENIKPPLEIINEYKYINLVSILNYVRRNSWEFNNFALAT